MVEDQTGTAKDGVIREPDENSGPAVLDREPIVLPEQRKEAVRAGRELIGGLFE